MAVATARDAAQVLVRAAEMFGADQAQVGHELSWMSEAMDVAQSLTVIMAATS